MTLVMDIIEKEIKAPVRNLLAGEVMHALLIQMQKLKADMEEEMLAVDKYAAARALLYRYCNVVDGCWRVHLALTAGAPSSFSYGGHNA